MKEELDKLKGMLGADRFQKGKFELAAQLFETMMTSANFDEFLTLAAYEYVCGAGLYPAGRFYNRPLEGARDSQRRRLQSARRLKTCPTVGTDPLEQSPSSEHRCWSAS
jgi:hypothetical protein